MAGLPIYVDNVDGDPGNDGLTETTAVKALSQAFIAADFDSGSTVYIKATSTDYAVYTTFPGTPAVPINNLILNRFPSDTGTSRPIFNRGDSETSSECVFMMGTIVGITFRNLYLKGKGAGTPGLGANSGVITAGSNQAGDFVFEDCILEQRHSSSMLRLQQPFPGDITFTRCHIWRHTDDRDTTNIDQGVVVQDSSSCPYENITMNDCVCENYVILIDAYYRDDVSAISMDHNTLVECGRTSAGKLIRLNGVLKQDQPITFTNNLIENSDDDPASIGIYDIELDAPGVTLNIDYNSWEGIGTPYNGAGAPSPANDMAITPEWPGCTNKEWTAAHIVMATYCAPIKDQAALVTGDSTGGTVGAIDVTLIGDESIIYDNRTTKAEADLEYYIVNSAFEDKMFSFSHGRGAQGSRFMYELEVTASRTRPTELRALAIDWFVKRKLKRRYGG